MSKLLYGMPTLIECNSLDETIDLCKELGLDFIEINMNLPQYQRHSIDINKMKSCMDKENIFFTIHLDENLNVCDFNEEVAKAYINTVMFTIEIAKELNIPVINMHMAKGVYFTLPDKKVYLFEKYREVYLEHLIKFRNLCEEKIGQSNIKICIENCDGYTEFMKMAVDTLLESKSFALTFDIGHDYCIGNKDIAFIEENINRLKHMHIHDAIGNKNHLPLGKGEIDIKEKLSLAKKYNCSCVLETKTIEGLRESVRYIRNNI
jgi:sugar phosphate isomerase/epimerase